MKQLKIRFSDISEKPQVKEWATATPHFDADVMEYPTLQVLASFNGAGPVAYLPMQRALILESAARKPGLTELESIQALRDLVKGAELVASSHGIREIYFLGTDDALASVAEAHGFEELPWKTYRMKL